MGALGQRRAAATGWRALSGTMRRASVCVWGGGRLEAMGGALEWGAWGEGSVACAPHHESLGCQVRGAVACLLRLRRQYGIETGVPILLSTERPRCKLVASEEVLAATDRRDYQARVCGAVVVGRVERCCWSLRGLLLCVRRGVWFGVRCVPS